VQSFLEKYKENCDVRRGLVLGKAEETEYAESRERKLESRAQPKAEVRTQKAERRRQKYGDGMKESSARELRP
jgi:hypothetical protein